MQQKAPLVKLAITTGEPAGVGPEVSFAATLDFLTQSTWQEGKFYKLFSRKMSTLWISKYLGKAQRFL
jgi:4-hydroxy-L-threonine phosphate dehydrogenase PdxA